MVLDDILNTPLEIRDEKWATAFCQELVGQSVRLLSPEPQQGPDGFAYLLLSTGEGDDAFLDLVGWGIQKGVGLVVNPTESSVDFMFTNGMLWNYSLRGEFFSPVSSPKEAPLEIKPDQVILTGQPNESYWPQSARVIFKEFLMQQGIVAGKAILILDEKDQHQADLCFSLESLGKPPESEWEGILEGFSWFFPRHYSLALVSEAQLKGAQFIAI